ncbi:MAG: hypothetical protein MJ057_09225, partial [Sphaerochaetaceae bacterium]|nr:hypothetical protein [Sphaerochaetaceae bacterium]
MGKGKTSNGQIAKYRKLATQYREMANEAMGSIASYKGALDKLNKELATFIGKDMSVDAEREKRDAVKSQIAANNDVLKGLSSKYKNADAIARRYEAMCGIDSPEAVEVEDIAAVEEGASSESASVQAPIQETEVEEAAPVSSVAEAPVAEESVVEKPVEAKAAPAKLNPLWAIIPLMLLSMLVGGALLRADKPRYYTSDIAVSPAVTATAPAATAAPKAETATVKVEAEKPQTSETPVIEVEKKAEKVEEVASQGVSVEGNASAIEKTPVEPETVAAVPAKAEEKPIAMFFGVSDAEVEQKYKAEGYDVVVLPPVVEEVVAAPEPVVETVEVAVEAEPVVEVVAEPEVVEEVAIVVEEPAAPVYEHHVECYGYSADIVAS